MYLSSLKLRNWRSFREAEFNFAPPTYEQRLVLIGGMNGSGKTSLLTALYLGLFGARALRYVEGFGEQGGDTYYRKAIESFRHRYADSSEPTEIEIEFQATSGQVDEDSVRVVRRWFFRTTGQLKYDNAEQLEVYVNDNPKRVSERPEFQHIMLEQLLFPVHVLPAFFFDGEQAQTMINTSGSLGLRRDLEVLYGVGLLESTAETLRQYISTRKTKARDQRKVHELESELLDKRGQRDSLLNKRTSLETLTKEHRAKLESLLSQLKDLDSKLAFASNAPHEIKSLEEQKQKWDLEESKRDDSVRNLCGRLGLSLAVGRREKQLLKQLDAEKCREEYELLRERVREKIEHVVDRVVPEPGTADPILGHLSMEDRQGLRDRVRQAVEEIYNPPPENAARVIWFGHVAGEARQRVTEIVSKLRKLTATELKGAVEELEYVRNQIGYVEQRIRVLRDTGLTQNEAVRDRFQQLVQEKVEINQRIKSDEEEIEALRTKVNELSHEIEDLERRVKLLRPEQRRLEVADRASIALNEIIDVAKSFALARLQDLVSTHFSAIADARYRNVKLELRSDGPVFKHDLPKMPEEPPVLGSTMSGFERRSFGIAFSLALLDATKHRIPLVIDTPLGNADTQYRPRLLDALLRAEVDQVILLTHDAELTKDLYARVENRVLQKFLIQYDGQVRASVVHADKFWFV